MFTYFVNKKYDLYSYLWMSEYNREEFCHFVLYFSFQSMHVEDCISRFQAWDFDAFGELYSEYIDQIFAYVFRKTSEKEIAEDLTSQVWMKAMKGLSSFSEKEGASFKSWIYTIAGNTVIDYYRTQKGQVGIEEIAEIGISEDIGKHIDNREKLHEVRTFLWHMKPLEQEIVILRLWDELSYKEIAEVVGKKEDNCKQIYKRTLEKIQANIILSCVLLILFL